MLPTTLTAIAAVLRADPSVSPDARTAMLTALKSGGAATAAAPTVRILKRSEVAARLGICTRSVDGLARTGALRRVKFPGRQRGAGYSERDVLSLIDGEGAA